MDEIAELLDLCLHEEIMSLAVCAIDMATRYKQIRYTEQTDKRQLLSVTHLCLHSDEELVILSATTIIEAFRLDISSLIPTLRNLCMEGSCLVRCAALDILIHHHEADQTAYHNELIYALHAPDWTVQCTALNLVRDFALAKDTSIAMIVHDLRQHPDELVRERVAQILQ
jgi:hypothetical protein